MRARPRGDRRQVDQASPAGRAGAPAGRDRVVVGFPAGGSVTVPFAASLLGLMARELARPFRERRLSSITYASGLYVADNRNTLARRFLRDYKAPWLLQIDTDISFPPTLLDSLLELAEGAGAKVVGANVPLGAFPSVAYRRKAEALEWESVYPLPRDPIFEVDGLATAIFLTHRDVLEAIADQAGACWFQHLYSPKTLAEPGQARDVDYHAIGEDLAFCLRAKSAGFPLYCAHGKTLAGLKHWKTKPLSEDDDASAEVIRRLLAEDGAAAGELVAEDAGSAAASSPAGVDLRI